MGGYEAFLQLFGDIRITDILVFILAAGYIIPQIKKAVEWLRGYLNKTEGRESALGNAAKLPAYHKQSIEIRDGLKKDISEIKEAVAKITHRLDAMEEKSKKKEANKLQNTLIQSYQYYTSAEKNPLRAWTKMEEGAFWAIFHDYEDAGGDGYIHSEVEPAMAALRVISMNDTAGMKELMDSRK